MTNGTKVLKRDGQTESLNLEKVHKMTEEACEGLAGVSASQVEIQSGIQFYDGITTAEIQEILVRSASDLIDLDTPNYQFVAARLLLFGLYKQVFGDWKKGFPSVREHLSKGVEKKIYDPTLESKYSEEEWDKINSWIDHNRDWTFTYAGLRQVVDKYLVQDRSTTEVYESPQFMYMLISAAIFAEYPQETRLDYIKRYYDAISRHKINIPHALSWQVLEHLFGNLRLVFWLILTTPWIVFLVLTWPLVSMSHKGLVLASTLVGSGVSTAKSGVEKFNTQVSFRFSKSLRQLSDVALKMASEVDQQLYTSQSGIKK